MAALGATAMLAAIPIHAAADYQTGHISRVSYVGDHLLIMIDTPLPGNCSNTTYSWMMVSATNKPMLAFVTGLWMRGDAADKPLVIYTSPTDGTGFCQVYQIDTEAAG